MFFIEKCLNKKSINQIDLAAEDLRLAVRNLGEIVGYVNVEELLDRIFKDFCIYMLGADHHGYIGRLKAIAACAGDDPEYNIHVLIGQLVKIMEGGEEVKLSKRAGTIITLEELVEKEN